MIFYRSWYRPKLISFDLDDTLYDNSQIIDYAEEYMKSYISFHYLKGDSLSEKTLTFTTARGATKILKVVSFSSRRIWNFSPLSLARISGALARTSDKGATNQCSSSPERISEESGIPSLL